jgi:hypothetical protein
VLNANYVRRGLEGHYHLPYASPTLHEVVFSDKLQHEHGVTTLDIAKRLMDYGFHPPTVYFPLIVSGALMIEPTESAGKEELDRFIAAMQAIAREAEEDPELLRQAPHETPVRRCDETRAARQPVLRWQPVGCGRRGDRRAARRGGRGGEPLRGDARRPAFGLLADGHPRGGRPGAAGRQSAALPLRPVRHRRRLRLAGR